MKKQEELEILRTIDKKNNSSQRELAKEFLKIRNFKKNKKKIGYLYLLTPLGITNKTKLTISFMQRKMEEYDELKKEIQKK